MSGGKWEEDGKIALRELPVGMVIQHRQTGNGYVIIGHDTAGFPICVRHVTATNPEEWTLGTECTCDAQGKTSFFINPNCPVHGGPDIGPRGS